MKLKIRLLLQHIFNTIYTIIVVPLTILSYTLFWPGYLISFAYGDFDNSETDDKQIFLSFITCTTWIAFLVCSIAPCCTPTS